MKTYVEVVALHTFNGNIQPLFIITKNKEKYPIDRILEERKAASLKHGGAGIRYTCRIQGQLRYLFHSNTTWFIEK